MERLKLLEERLKALGMTDDEISYALKPLEPLRHAFNDLLETFDNTPVPMIFVVKKLERKE